MGFRISLKYIIIKHYYPILMFLQLENGDSNPMKSYEMKTQFTEWNIVQNI
jgi:hypothetical protein